MRPGGKRVLIADAGRREREVDASRLHEYPTRGVPRRTGYALADTHAWLTLLTDLALRKYPYTITGSAIDQDVRRGGYLRLDPNVALPVDVRSSDRGAPVLHTVARPPRRAPRRPDTAPVE
ncbi:hypothetical protein GCM10010276_87410 [Streptomyces longisporus]|uniref:Uncharacterized protein n=1 Tax=Streptomyces longisporus TaxID=1948 RepID=A0ABN3NI26_STRLO